MHSAVFQRSVSVSTTLHKQEFSANTGVVQVHFLREALHVSTLGHVIAVPFGITTWQVHVKLSTDILRHVPNVCTVRLQSATGLAKGHSLLHGAGVGVGVGFGVGAGVGAGVGVGAGHTYQRTCVASASAYLQKQLWSH